MASKYYRIDFYQISLIPTADIAAPSAGFQAFIDGAVDSTYRDGGYTREIYGLDVRSSGRSIGGRLRKFRTTDLPEIGGFGADSAEIVLGTGEGLIEQNFFVWYRQHNVIAWHVNGHASPPTQLAALLSHTWGTQVYIDPIIQTEALQRLLAGNVEVKKLKVSVARPTNPALFPNDVFTPALLGIMSQSDADAIHLEMGVNLRLNPEGSLAVGVKQLLQNLVSIGATTARAIVEEDGITHPIDLIADRVSTTVVSASNSRFPLPATMYQLIDGAQQECQGAIDDYFSSVGPAIR